MDVSTSSRRALVLHDHPLIVDLIELALTTGSGIEQRPWPRAGGAADQGRASSSRRISATPVAEKPGSVFNADSRSRRPATSSPRVTAMAPA